MSIQWSAWKCPTTRPARSAAFMRASTCGGDAAADVEQDCGLAGLDEHAGLRAVADRSRGPGAEDGQAHGSSSATCRRHGSGSALGAVVARESAHRRRDSRIAAAAIAARPRPSEPPRNTTRVSRCAASGVTTATVTAVSPPRSRASTASPTSASPSSRTRSARCSSVARWPSCGSGRARSASPNASRSARPSPSSASSAPRSPTSTAARRQPRASSAVADARRPGRLAARPDVVAEHARRSVASTPATTRGRPPAPGVVVRPDADVDRVGARVGGDHRPRPGVEQRAQPGRDRRFADAREPERHRRDRPAETARRRAAAAPSRPTSGASRAAAPAARR